MELTGDNAELTADNAIKLSCPEATVLKPLTDDFDMACLGRIKLLVADLDKTLYPNGMGNSKIDPTSEAKEEFDKNLEAFMKFMENGGLAIIATGDSPALAQRKFDRSSVAWTVEEHPGVFCNGSLVLGVNGVVEHSAPVPTTMMQQLQAWARAGDGFFEFEGNKYPFAINCMTKSRVLYLPSNETNLESQKIAEDWASLQLMTNDVADIEFDWEAFPAYQVNILLKSNADLLQDFPVLNEDAPNSINKIQTALLDNLEEKIGNLNVAGCHGKHVLAPWCETNIVLSGVNKAQSLNRFIHCRSVKEHSGVLNVGTEVMVAGAAANDLPMFVEWSRVEDFNGELLEKTDRPPVRIIMPDAEDDNLSKESNLKNKVHEVLAAIPKASTMRVVAPTDPPAAVSRPFKKLKSSCVDISDVDDGQDCLNISGAPRKAVPMLRQRKNQRDGPPKSPAKAKKAAVEGEGTEEETQWELVLSARAAQETALIEILQTREFTLDELGRVEIDDHMQAGALARHRSEQPGDLAFEDAGAFDMDPPRSPRSSRSPRSRLGRRASDLESSTQKGFDLFCEWRQRQIDLNFIRQQLQEQSSLGNISANLKNIVTAPGVNPIGGGLGLVTDGTAVEPIPPGSEPPPTPAMQRRRRNVSGDEDLGSAPSGVDDRYLHVCTELGVHSKPTVLKALRAVEHGGSSLPVEFTHGSYLGDRGAQALFQTLVSDDSHDVHELNDLRTLDLHGLGIGNEAASALAQFLPRCPHLRVVNLSKNHISETGLQKLMDEVRVHPSLDILNIDMNPIPSWQRVRLKELLGARRDGPWRDNAPRFMLNRSNSGGWS